MNVKFSNCEVPIWKLRYGTVVGIENDKHTSYGHLMGFRNKVCGDVFLIVCIGDQGFTLKPSELLWLEPV